MPMMVAGTGCSRAVCTSRVASALDPSLKTPSASKASCCGVSLPAIASTVRSMAARVRSISASIWWDRAPPFSRVTGSLP